MSKLANASAELLARYEQQPLLRGLVQLIPFGDAVESTLLARLSRYRHDRLREFFDELGAGRLPLSEELIEDDEFLFCYFATVSAVLRSRRVEKVRYLARLLRGAFVGVVRDADEYEELVAVTDDLSTRELGLLALLARHESKTPIQQNENELQRASRFWGAFVLEATNELGIPEDLVAAMLVRLQRSGCYQEFAGSYLGYTGGRGRVTALYHRLASAAGHISDIHA